MKLVSPLLAVIALSLAACTSLHSSLPLTDLPPQPSLSSSVFAGRWEAVKEIHRRHPGYDGRAGPRDQTLYFTVRTSPASDGGLDLTVEGSLGTGSGHEGPESGLIIELAAAARGWLVPFDTIRIRQSRGGTDGRLAESVELFSRSQGKEIPFMRMEEEGTVYRPATP
jgi:hypothetical protein